LVSASFAKPQAPCVPVLTIEINNDQAHLSIDEDRLQAAARAVLEGEGIKNATISLAVVDDPTMHELNRRYLNHDYPTDVLSFVLERTAKTLEGDVIVSADTADSMAKKYGWSPADELLLYVVHGMLHLTGHDDTTADALAKMRERERQYLLPWGLEPRYESDG
jgi:probable rRNA maturation factor